MRNAARVALLLHSHRRSFSVGVLLLAAHLPITTLAQGAGDPGVGMLSPLGEVFLIGGQGAQGYDDRSSARLALSYGTGEQGTLIWQAIPEVVLALGTRFHVQARIPFIQVRGDLGSVQGAGDPTLSGRYALVPGGPRKLDVLVGIKVNVNQADHRDDEGRALPMVYQTSLGTQDMFIGLNYRHDRFSMALAYQHVRSNLNQNGFLHKDWTDQPKALGYTESARLDRADDLVARLHYAFHLKSLVLQPGLLGLAHLDDDRRSDPTGTELIEVTGSRGFTLNATLLTRYPMNDTWSIEPAIGAPLVLRDAQPDGLMRAVVATVAVRCAF